MENLENLKKEYKKKGFLKIKNFFEKKEILTVRENIKSNIKKNNKKHFFYYEKIKKKKVLRRIEKISEYSRDAKKIIYNKKIKKITKILTNNNFKLFKEKLNFKYPGGEGFKPHIDGHFLWKDKNNKIRNGWKEYSNDFLSIVIPLEKVNKKNGCLELSSIQNTKKIGSNFNEITSNIIEFTPNVKKSLLKKFKWTPIEMEIGDILIFNWKCAHKSRKNYSSNSRMIFYATFYKSNKIQNVKKKYYLDKQNSLNPTKNKSLQ